MKFSTYMQAWLYGKKGYYRNFKEIGKGGDFYTAVSSSAFFGASIANYFYTLLKEDQRKRSGWLIEVGAHKGYLLCDMIQWLYTCDPALIKSLKFGIVEPHAEVRKVQAAYIQERFGNDIDITHFDDVSDLNASYAFVVANEIFDAFACDLIKDEKIAVVDNHTIGWEKADQDILNWAKKHRLHQGEIAVGYESFAKRMFKGTKECDFITFDYGEKYVRNDFSIRVYRNHETFPLFDQALILSEAYQRDDMTYDVNFGHVSEAFIGAGFREVLYETQARALIRFGIIEILEEFMKQTTQTRYAREADKVKTLISPTMMGDRFKMIHFSKGG